MSRAEANADRGREGNREGKGGLLVPGLVNLALGVPAMIPLHLARWLLTEYLPMDCHSSDDLTRPGLTNCDYHTLDHAYPVMFLLAVTGLFMLALILVVDVLRPRQRGTWLGMAVLIPVPFAVCTALF